MVDSVMGLGPIVTKHLYEKGLQIPPLTGSSIHSDSSRLKSDVARGRRQRRSSQCSNLTASSSSSSSAGNSSRCEQAIAKSERTIDKRPSVVTLDFQGDESVRSFQMNQSGTASSKGKNWKHNGKFKCFKIFLFSCRESNLLLKLVWFCIKLNIQNKKPRNKIKKYCDFNLLNSMKLSF